MNAGSISMNYISFFFSTCTTFFLTCSPAGSNTALKKTNFQGGFLLMCLSKREKKRHEESINTIGESDGGS